MNNLSVSQINKIFQSAIEKYHIIDDINQPLPQNLYNNNLDNLLFEKCWIDTIQWHLEDLIRDPNIEPIYAVELKRRIDISNQKRTDIVEQIDDYLFDLYKDIPLQKDFYINTESIGWAIDRLSILNLKVYHWQQETIRKDITSENLKKAYQKLEILNQQHKFLSDAISLLIDNIFKGRAIARPFKQMKMYNDPETNPILRNYLKNDSINK